MPERSWLPLSILVAGALAGAGLYFGLRERATPPADSAAISSIQSPSEASTPPPPDASTPDTARTRAQQAVAAQLRKDRARIVARCWEPSLRRARQPESVTIPLRFSFLADGRQHMFAVGSPSAPERQDVADCVRDLSLEYRVEPSADLTGAHIELTLP